MLTKLIMNNKKLLKISEASEFLNVHPNTLRKWDKKGILKSIRIGERKDRRYKLEDLKKITINK